MNRQLTTQDASKFEPEARRLASNGVAQSLSFTMERKYLNIAKTNSKPFSLEVPNWHKMDLPAAPFWIKISQIGKPLENSAENCFTAIQKILSSCFVPHKTQLLFLVHGVSGEYSIYLGLRSFDKAEIDVSFVDGLSNFINGVWPGVKCQRVKGSVNEIQEKIRNKYNFIDALTGIPSMESQYKSVYPATIDTLLSGMRNKDFSYLVIADPIPENDIDGILYQCREYNGQAESLKSFNFSENMSSSIGKSLSEAKSVTDGFSDSESISSTKKSPWGGLASGLVLASYVFPPAGAITSAISTAGAILEASQMIAGTNLIAEFSPTKTKSTTHTTNHSETTTRTETDSMTEQQGRSISHNIVNKQIEAVSEELFYHSQRFATGKAIGCWSVGVYLMSEKKNELNSASLQLKSIVSGQESSFEPIRIHHIEDIINNILPETLGSMDVPVIRVKTLNGYFEHPLGEHFNDLRTVLTTKELSYFVNFPLHGVPGISVVDSSPEFSLNNNSINSDGITFGKLLYGGSETMMDYIIPSKVLSRHTLVSGINGSGKTNTIQAILNGMGEIPFMVVEPAKTEYVDWAIAYNKTHPDAPIDIYIPGCNKYRGSIVPKALKINPFELIWISPDQEPNILSHIDRLKSIFAAAFPMYDILPVLMEDLIYTVYQNPSTDWLTKQPVFGKTVAPTLNSMSVSVDKVIEHRQYEDKIQRNMKACLNTRIDSLKRGWKGELLNTIKSTPWQELFNRRCVINLSYVGDDVDKSFLMALILKCLYEYRAAMAELGKVDFNSDECKHLTIIEEAHRVMSKCENVESPQYKSAMLFSNMLSEIRAYGEGLMLADQVPTRLIPDAIKNTNLKIIHRLVAEDDTKAVGEAMSLSNNQRKVISKLMTGQCVVSSSLSTDTYWVKVNKVK